MEQLQSGRIYAVRAQCPLCDWWTQMHSEKSDAWAEMEEHLTHHTESLQSAEQFNFEEYWQKV